MASLCVQRLTAARGNAAAPPALVLTPGFPVFPVATGLVQTIKVSLPPGTPAGIYDVSLRSESGMGVLLLPSGPSPSGTVRCSPGAPAVVRYRWAGANPVSGPFSERVSAEAAGIGASGSCVFSVGTDVRIAGASIPGNIAAGKFSPVDVYVADAFNPETDLPSLMNEIGASADLSLSLVLDSAESGEAAAADPAEAEFFGDGGATGQAFGFMRGRVVRSGGKYVWEGVDARAGISPPSAGVYHIEAALRANMGGIPLKYWSSPQFRASSYRGAWNGLPVLMASSLRIISRLDAAAAGRAGAAIEEALGRGDQAGAAAMAGAAFAASLGTPPGSREGVERLGRLASALGASGESADAIASFMGGFVRGYGEGGVLIFTKGGVSKWRETTGASRAAASENARYVAAPFSQGGNMAIRIEGSGTNGVSLWKIIPEGVNAKKYPAGKWIKEITVHTSEVAPLPRE
jgi:hypothetical protein